MHIFFYRINRVIKTLEGQVLCKKIKGILRAFLYTQGHIWEFMITIGPVFGLSNNAGLGHTHVIFFNRRWYCSRLHSPSWFFSLKFLRSIGAIRLRPGYRSTFVKRKWIGLPSKATFLLKPRQWLYYASVHMHVSHDRHNPDTLMRGGIQMRKPTTCSRPKCEIWRQ